MKLDLSFAELHNPLFLGGTNWGMKLHKHQAKGHLDLAYDRDNKELLVRHQGDKGVMIAIIPTSNVASMTPSPESLEQKLSDSIATAVNPLVNPPKGKPGPKPKLSAQASSPHDHVFAKGPGKTND